MINVFGIITGAFWKKPKGEVVCSKFSLIRSQKESCGTETYENSKVLICAVYSGSQKSYVIGLHHLLQEACRGSFVHPRARRLIWIEDDGNSVPPPGHRSAFSSSAKKHQNKASASYRWVFDSRY